jgi:CBS-domain-containing membrane protein
MDPTRLLQSPRLPLALADGPSEAPRVSPADPARRVMTDLALGPVSVAASDSPIDVVLRTMKDAGVRFLFVLDDAGRLVGSVGAHDIQGEKPLQFLGTAGGGRTWRDVRVQDVMEPVSEWRVLDVGQVDRLTVRDVVALLADAGRRHLVVVADAPGGGQRVRGLFSASRVQQQLGVSLDAGGRATTFAEIERAIA